MVVGYNESLKVGEVEVYAWTRRHAVLVRVDARFGNSRDRVLSFLTLIFLNREQTQNSQRKFVIFTINPRNKAINNKLYRNCIMQKDRRQTLEEAIGHCNRTAADGMNCYENLSVK